MHCSEAFKCQADDLCIPNASTLQGLVQRSLHMNRNDKKQVSCNRMSS